ncbi:hypothetical protein [Actibacterium sp. 188UL27-1]|uniref:hypothetical protein n=1 Tax=Actibacterium sp. 188UL27-1 TaxID=2786961 RepID=UPI00195F1EB7|nr:hypothetical protein [Actibacterium sp. 188UL27-1]MBM7067995.1 hypothetical protein [Actibacterium sp. 188UL27-1]
MGRKLLEWDEWQPGLDTDDMTLAAVLATMPKSDADDVPEVVRKYENPESPDALPGAISLARHDCLHVILGRGLHVQDEAFIIGVTMGADTTMTGAITEEFIHISTTLYPKVWRFQPDHIASYRLGVGFGMDNLKGADLHLTAWEAEPHQSQTIAALRRDLGLSKPEMRAYYRKEELLVPGTRATRRLDTSGHRQDRDLT